ncbi:hypothetical protein [Paenibacillus alvei]|uniref:hypothetical protein n=3 Tax=Paenibacillus alvei TaxID=44250 RepID=UPI0018CD89B6|nr:hypothetical protein [Paenibacillus alvei]
MSNAHLAKRVRDIRRDSPVGALTPVGNNGYARDTLGRMFRIRSMESVEAGRRRAQVSRDKRDFSFTHMQNIEEITRELSNKYCGYLLLLQPHIEYKTGRLVEQGRAPRPLTVQDIAKVWNVSKRTAQAAIREFELRSIIFDVNGVFSINERYHFRDKGNGVDALIKTFFSPLRKFKLSAADFGFVFKLLRHVHYETNMVCADPFVAPEDIRFLPDKEIGDIVGLTESKTKEALTRLRKAKIIGEWINVDDKREKLTVLNPYVFYRKSGEPDATLRAMFAGCRVPNEN